MVQNNLDTSIQISDFLMKHRPKWEWSLTLAVEASCEDIRPLKSRRNGLDPKFAYGSHFSGVENGLEIYILVNG